MRKRGHRRSTKTSVWSVVAALLAVAGLALLGVGCSAQQNAPQPSPTEAGTYALGAQVSSGAPASTGQQSSSAGAPTSPAVSPTPATVGPILARSLPTHLAIPAIGVDSDLIQLGLNPDGSVQTPPFEPVSHAGWYTGSPTPGQLGPSVILGHIDSAKYGPGVFFKLGALHKGDTIAVTRADRTVATFRVDAVAEYPKSHFPTTTVYGNTDHAALRLITCGGQFNFSERSYEDNIVAFASLVSSRPA